MGSSLQPETGTKMEPLARVNVVAPKVEPLLEPLSNLEPQSLRRRVPLRRNPPRPMGTGGSSSQVRVYKISRESIQAMQDAAKASTSIARDPAFRVLVIDLLAHKDMEITTDDGFVNSTKFNFEVLYAPLRWSPLPGATDEAKAACDQMNKARLDWEDSEADGLARLRFCFYVISSKKTGSSKRLPLLKGCALS
jgi:hypothetical protein